VWFLAGTYIRYWIWM